MLILMSHSTLFQLYTSMWRHIDVQADWRSWTYTVGLPRQRHFGVFFNVPVPAPTRGYPFYGYSKKPPNLGPRSSLCTKVPYLAVKKWNRSIITESNIFCKCIIPIIRKEYTLLFWRLLWWKIIRKCHISVHNSL